MSSIVIVYKKHDKLYVCNDYMKVNGITKTNSSLLFFTNTNLEIVASHKLYFMLNGFNGYNQIPIDV